MESWPAGISSAAREVVGEVVRVERLGGMSGGTVERLRGERGTAIVKRMTRGTEPFIYKTLRAELVRRGIAMPQLYAADSGPDGNWLLLEDIAEPFPRERSGSDPQQLALLARLHAAPVDLLRDIPERYLPSWDDTLTRDASRLLPSNVPDRLYALQRASQPLFAPLHPISADPNPPNWGLRDSAPVLFDWERLTLGTAAIDLAITLTGLPDADACRRVVASYQAAGGVVEDAAETAWLVQVAKVWTIVELLAQVARGEVERNATIAWVIRSVETWSTTRRST